jgi:hypothetical protein
MTLPRQCGHSATNTFQNSLASKRSQFEIAAIARGNLNFRSQLFSLSPKPGKAQLPSLFKA